MKPAIFGLTVSSSLMGELVDQITEQFENKPPQARDDEWTAPARIEITRETVTAQSLSDVATLIVAIGGGAGIAAIGNGLAKAIKIFSDKHPTGNITYEKDGLRIELANLPTAKLNGLLDIIVRQTEPDFSDNNQDDDEARLPNAPEVVEAFGLPEGKIIDGLYDPITGTYYAPSVIGDPLPPTSLPRAREQLVAFIDTGIMTHHPWVKGNIDEYADFTNEGIEDRSGHGTAVALVALSAFKGLSPDEGGPRLVVVKALDQYGRGSEEQFIEALEWVAARHVDVVQLSLGIYRDGGCKPDCKICGLVEQISIDGAWVTVAAGNDPNRYTCPHPRHFATQKVGATNPEGTALGGYSGPGASILAKLPPGFVPVQT